MKRRVLLAGCLFGLSATVVACGGGSSGGGEPAESRKNLVVSALPDQDPEKLQRLYDKLSKYLEAELKVPVAYKPVTDYTAAVTAFKTGDVDLVWFGGFTGVQARQQVPDSQAIAQRIIDERFTSVFIANKKAEIKPFTAQSDLKELKGRTFTFGSESSTSGRIMPQYFLMQAGIKLDDFKGEVGFAKNHDAVIEVVQAGTYEVGVVNSKVWSDRVQAGSIDTSKVGIIWQTPEYHDYHWVIHPSTRDRFGKDFPDKVKKALLKLNHQKPDDREILDMFSTTEFVETVAANYEEIEKVAKEVGKLKESPSPNPSESPSPSP